MFGIIIYLYFLVLGFAYSKYIFKDKDTYYCIWLGGIIGNLIAMCGIAVSSLVFGFTVSSHIILMILSVLPLAILVKKYGLKPVCSTSSKICTNKIFFLVILPITVLIAILITNHVLVPTENGAVASGQSTYGDLNMHLGFITSIAEQKKFPPDYVFLSGYQLNYPFFINMLSSTLYLFGTSLRMAVLLPSYVISALLIMGFYFLGYKISKNLYPDMT